MLRRLHLTAALLATACIALFLVSTLLIETFGTPSQVAALKALIVLPGLFVLVPAIALAGGSGFALARRRGGRLVEAKTKRMPFIAANGLLVLVPCALLLARWSALGSFDSAFLAVQAIELAAGAINLGLIGLNLRDGLRLTRRAAPAPG